jgi:Protein of unknown function (DUF2971)
MILYKYLTPARLDVLDRRRIRFTQPAAFNDPFEFKPYIESAASQEHLRDQVEQNFDEILRRELKEYPILNRLLPGESAVDLLRPFKSSIPGLFQMLEPQLLSHVSAAINSAFNANVGVLCLSEIRDSLLMWGHYTDNHEGFVIGFDQNHPFFSVRRGPEDEFGFLRQVKYCRNRPRVTMTNTTGAEWFETKSDEWAYEKEWRMLRVLQDVECRLEGAPHPICLFSFPTDAVVEIIAGLRCSLELRERLRTLSKGYPKARLFLAEEHSSEYALSIRADSARSLVALPASQNSDNSTQET